MSYAILPKAGFPCRTTISIYMHENSNENDVHKINSLRDVCENLRYQILQDGIELVVEDGLSIREAAAEVRSRYGVLSPSHLGKYVKQYHETGTLDVIADKRAERNGSKPKLNITTPGWIYVLGFKAAGQGSWTKGIRELKKYHLELDVPKSQIPTANQIYYAKKKTPEIFAPAFQRSLAEQYDLMKMRTAKAKKLPNEKMQGDEMVHKMLSLKDGEEMEFHIFIAADAATNTIRMPTMVNRAYDTHLFMKALKTSMKPAPELGLPQPCCPAEYQIDNYPVHRCRSVRESARRFKEEMNMPFKIRYSLKKVPKSNAKAERIINVVREFTRAFANHMTILSKSNPGVLKYAEIFWKELLEYIKDWNFRKSKAEPESRIVAYHRRSQIERVEFDPAIIDKCFHEYREVMFEADQGASIAEGIHLDSPELIEWVNKQVVIALNPDNLEADASAYFLKSKRAEFKYLGKVVHSEANPGLKNEKIRAFEQLCDLAATSNVTLATKYIELREALFAAKYPNAGRPRTSPSTNDAPTTPPPSADSNDPAKDTPSRDNTPTVIPQRLNWLTEQEAA